MEPSEKPFILRKDLSSAADLLIAHDSTYHNSRNRYLTATRNKRIQTHLSFLNTFNYHLAYTKIIGHHITPAQALNPQNPLSFPEHTLSKDGIAIHQIYHELQIY